MCGVLPVEPKNDKRRSVVKPSEDNFLQAREKPDSPPPVAVSLGEEDAQLQHRKANTRRVSMLLKIMIREEELRTKPKGGNEERFVQEESVNLRTLREDPLWLL
eukprot:Rhum_TRINITY_DN12187_c0_g1::Rhum_TRINITY_DN12187_c0_g1_i1::g.49828::m.49828